MKITPQNMAQDYAHSSSVTNPKNVFPIAVETSLSSLSTLHYSDTSPEENTISNLYKVSTVQNKPTKY